MSQPKEIMVCKFNSSVECNFYLCEEDNTDADAMWGHKCALDTKLKDALKEISDGENCIDVLQTKVYQLEAKIEAAKQAAEVSIFEWQEARKYEVDKDTKGIQKAAIDDLKEIIALLIPRKEPQKEENPLCPYCGERTTQVESWNDKPAYSCFKCKRIASCNKDYLESAFKEDLAAQDCERKDPQEQIK
jgi:hypothetical protein